MGGEGELVTAPPHIFVPQNEEIAEHSPLKKLFAIRPHGWRTFPLLVIDGEQSEMAESPLDV